MHFQKVFGRIAMKQNNGDLILGWGVGWGTKLKRLYVYIKSFYFEVRVHRKLQRNVQGGSMHCSPGFPQRHPA